MPSAPQIAPSAVYRFDRFELLPETRQLRKNGTIVHLAPQPFRVLLLLVSRPGKVVTREEIHAELWGDGTFVDFEQGINAVIRRIRFALNDQAETPRFLQTFPRIGYRFVAPVECELPFEPPPAAIAPAHAPSAPIPATLPPPQTHRIRIPRARIASLLVLMTTTLFAARGPHDIPIPGAPAPPIVRLAVSPIVIEGTGGLDPRTITSELFHRLAQLPPQRVRIVAPGSPADLRIDCAWHKAPDGTWSADASLTDTATGRRVWHEVFRRSGNAAGFPLEVAVRVSLAVVNHRVPPVRREFPIRSAVRTRALALYREGLSLRRLPYPQGDLDRATTLFENAVTLEPGFAEAWSAIGDIWTERALFWGPSRRTAIAQARIAIDRAIALDSNCAESLNNRGLLLMRFDNAYAEAETAFRKAIDADSQYVDAHVNLAQLLSAMGRHSESLPVLRRAQFLDPARFVPNPLLANLYLMERRYSDAFAEYEASLILSARPDAGHLDLLLAAMTANRPERAAQSLAALLGESGMTLQTGDSGSELRTHFRRLESKLPRMERDGLDPYIVACYYAQAGDAERAFAALDRTLVRQSRSAMFAAVDPRLDPIRNDPRFLDFLERWGLRI